MPKAFDHVSASDETINVRYSFPVSPSIAGRYREQGQCDWRRILR